MPDHKSSCKAVAKKYGTDSESERSRITHFGKFVLKALGNRFRMEKTNSEEDTCWPAPMLGKSLGKKGLEWMVRPELADALQWYLIECLLKEYRDPILSEGLDSTRSHERYKWQHISSLGGNRLRRSSVS